MTLQEKSFEKVRSLLLASGNFKKKLKICRYFYPLGLVISQMLSLYGFTKNCHSSRNGIYSRLLVVFLLLALDNFTSI